MNIQDRNDSAENIPRRNDSAENIPHRNDSADILRTLDRLSALPAHADALLAPRQVAAFLGIGLRTLDELIRRGDLAKVQISPRRIGVRLGDLSDFVAARRVMR